jgi:ribokinase
MKNKVVVVGSFNTDMTIKAKKIPGPGETVIGGHFSTGGGGKGANQAIAAARIGAEVSFVARVGNDLLGREGIKRLNEEHINTKYIYRDNELPTGVAFIVVDDKGENSIVVASGANANLSPTDIESASDEISSADILLIQLESPIEFMLLLKVRMTME